MMTAWEVLDTECGGAEWETIKESSAPAAATAWVAQHNANVCEYPACRRVAVRVAGDTEQGMQFDVELETVPTYHATRVLHKKILGLEKGVSP